MWYWVHVPNNMNENCFEYNNKTTMNLERSEENNVLEQHIDNHYFNEEKKYFKNKKFKIWKLCR